MGYRYTIVEKDEDHSGMYNLFCFEDDDCVWQDRFKTEDKAVAYGIRFLDGEFKNGFEIVREAE
jgi:hypothetical protein